MPFFKTFKKLIRSVPILGPAAAWVWRRIVPARGFPGTLEYWETRYRDGGDSGSGSYNRLAEFKAGFINRIVKEYSVASVIEFGCGDGNQLLLARYPMYLGFDVSKTAIQKCRRAFAGDGSKSFRLLSEYRGEKADLSLSLDVVYHLIEDSLYDSYLRTLFDSSLRLVIIYSSNDESLNAKYGGGHVRHRVFTDWVGANRPEWTLREKQHNEYPFNPEDRDNTSLADFYVFHKSGE